MRRFWLCLVLLLPAAVGCATVHTARPVPPGSLVLENSLGGPAFQLGPWLELPLLVSGVRYGLSPRLNAQAHLHLTGLAIKPESAPFPLTGVDLGATWYPPLPRPWPLVSVTITDYLWTNLGAARIHTDVNWTAGYAWGARRQWFAYAGSHQYVQYQPAQVAFAPFAGLNLDLGRHWTLALESKWYRPDLPTRGQDFRTVRWLGPGNQGALGFLLGATWRFGAQDRSGEVRP